MAKWNGEIGQNAKASEQTELMEAEPLQMEPVHTQILKKNEDSKRDLAYADPPANLNFEILQNNLQNCLSILDNEVMKNYVPALQNCEVKPVTDVEISALEQIQFFRITELVYQEDEFSVHKLATIFHALSNKPCTLVLMIQSDGQTNNFYLGVRSRDSRFSGGTMRQLLEQSLLGIFPGSNTADYFTEVMQSDLDQLRIGAVSSVTCIADYKQENETLENKNYIQGLEKFIYSMQGKAFTAICIANNLQYRELTDIRKEYERIYTLMSPFANMQYNYAVNESTSRSDSDTKGESSTDSTGSTKGISKNINESETQSYGTNKSHTVTNTTGENSSITSGKTRTNGITEGVSDSDTTTKTGGTNIGFGSGIGNKESSKHVNFGVSSSVSRGHTKGTSHTESVSNAISKNLTSGINSSQSIGDTVGDNQSFSKSYSSGLGAQYSENENHSETTNYAYTQALTDTFGKSQAVTLNMQNKALQNMLERLEKQMKRLEECESIGMWDFAAYFLGESVAEVESAASMYRSLVSGSQSGLELAAVNTWNSEKSVADISKYLLNFLHPVFLYKVTDENMRRQTYVDATALASTKELAIQFGLPRKSVKGLPVTEHALFAQEVLTQKHHEYEEEIIELGVIDQFGKETETAVELDLNSFAMHTFITGSTGSGKSNAVYQLLREFDKKQVHFMVIEPAKGEYKHVFGDAGVKVYGTNHYFTPLLKINPFKFPKGIHVLEHIDRLIEIFNVCWPMYAAMPAVLKDSVERAYVNAGWDLATSCNKYSAELYPTFVDILHELTNVVAESAFSQEVKDNYTGSLVTRIKSLTNGIYGCIFDNNELGDRQLFDENVIVDLSRVGSVETKSMIMGILVMRLQEYRMTSGQMNADLRHVTVLEEAHNLLKRTSTEQSSESSNLLGKSVEMLSNAIAEVRTYGEGFIIADQAPGLLDLSVIRNTNTKIIMRLPDAEDRELVGKAANLTDDQIKELAKLPTGVAAIYQNNWLEPVLCKVNYKKTTGMYVNREKNSLPNSDDKKKLIERLLCKAAGERLDVNIEQVVKEVINANLPTRIKTQAIEIFKKKGNLTLDDISSVTYDMVSSSEIEKKAEKADSIEEWKNAYLYAKDSVVADLPKNAQDEIAECILREQIARYDKPDEYLETWYKYIRGK